VRDTDGTRRTLARRALGVVAMLAVWVVVVEVALQLLCLSPRIEAVVTGHGPEPLVPDARLGLHGNADYPDHDEWGYRNAERPERADVVALGDSQTYGTGVKRDEAWPAALQRRLGTRVYSMATPNFGTAHYWLELDRALSLQPRAVLVTVYFGNDIYDAFRLATLNPEIGALTSSDLLREGEELEKSAPLATTGQTLFEPATVERRSLGTPRRLLSEYSRLYNVASTLSRRLSERGEQAEASSAPRDVQTRWRALSPKQRALTSAYDDGDWHTILTASYRRTVVDYRDPRIEAGFAVMRGSLARMAARAREAGVHLVVAFIPTKENVFAGRIRDFSQHALLQDLVADEEALKRTVIADMDALGVEHIDLLNALRASPAQPYDDSMNGHPNVAGHNAIAAEIARFLQARRDGERPAA
jgi:lysophospholipase L1-like esterase